MSIPHLFRRFQQDESGQSLAFGALTFFALVVMVLMIVGISDVTSTQMEIQNAADSAAFSATEVKADCVAQIAWMNEAMSSIWYDAQRMCAETSVTAVHATLKNRQARYGHAAFASLFGGSPYPTDDIVGVPNAPTLYAQTWQAARTYIPQGYAWLQRLSRIQRGIAILAPLLTEQQVFHTARENGSQVSAMYRSFLFTPMGPSLCYMDIERYKASEQTKGWRMNGQGLSGTMFFEALHTPPDHTGVTPSSREDDVEFANGSTRDLVRYEDQPDRWDITLNRNGDNVTIRIDSDYAFDGDTGATVYPLPEEAYAMHKLTLTRNGNADEWWVYDYGDGNVAIIHPQSGGTDENVTITQVHETPPYFRIDENGHVYFIRPQPYGYDYTDETDAQGKPTNWQIIDRTGDAGDSTTTIDGVEIPISFPGDYTSHRIELASGLYVDLGPPHHLEWSGVMTATLSTPMNFSVIPISPFWRITATDREATVHGLSTRSNADGLWRRVWHSDYWNDTDRVHHRMLTVQEENMDPDSPQYWSGQWRYEWMREGADMKDMNMLRLSCHGIMNYDPQFTALGGDASADTTYLESVYGDSQDWHINGPAGSSLWTHFPRWARPPRDPALISAAPEDFGGWFNIGHTASAVSGKPVTTTAYSQSRTCWFCGEENDSLQIPRNRASNSHDHLRDIDPQSPTYELNCLRPCGFWHETFTGENFQTEANDRIQAINTAFASAFPGMIGAVQGPANVAGMTSSIQVTCPVCARKALLAQGFFEHGQPAFNATAPEELAETPSVVRVYLAEAIGAHDSSQSFIDPFMRTIRSYPDPAFGLTATNRYEFFGITPPGYSNARPDLMWLPPLELTAEIFRYGVSVAVWKEREEGLLTSLAPNNRSTGMINPLGYPRWGHFAIATSRMIFWNQVFNGTPDRTAALPSMTFEWTGSRPSYITEPENAIDILGRPVNWNREIFLRSQLNLFDPDWNAALVSNREALDLRDVYFESDDANANIADDSEIGYLMRMIRSADWRRSASDGRRLETPNMNTMGINFDDEAMDRIMRH